MKGLSFQESLKRGVSRRHLNTIIILFGLDNIDDLKEHKIDVNICTCCD